MSNKRVITMVIDHVSKTIRPVSMDDFYTMLGFFPDNTKVTVTIEPFTRPAELSQANLFHKYIALMSQETGQEFAECKTEMKRLFGARDENTGKVKSTTTYTTAEYTKLIEGTILTMTQNLGMVIPSVEEWKKNNLK